MHSATLDFKACFRALASRDRRFEGRFFAAVRTTGVYCRAGCPAPLPKPRNVTFFVHPAAAEEAGFRPCRRCRPEMSPEIRTWPDTSRTVSRAVRLIAGGALDGAGSLTTLGARLGVGERHLRRLFARHLGASPVAFAQSRRVHLARRLLDESALPIADIALSAGFSSVRRFNEVYLRTFSAPPSEARRVRGKPDPGEEETTPAGTGSTLRLRVPFMPPYDWDSLIGFLAARAIPGVEAAGPDVYRRSIAMEGSVGGIEVRRLPGENGLQLRISATFPLDVLPIVERVRRLFDLDCDAARIAEHLGRDRRLGPMVERRPGLRVPGAWDPFELSVRAVLGQQVTVRGARTLAGRLVDAFGAPAAVPWPGITHRFPTADRLAGADLRRIGIPGARARTIRDLARAVAEKRILLDGGQDLEATVAALSALRGIGPWTAQYIAMRGLGFPDAFPAGDLGLRKALARGGKKPGEAAIHRAAERWRPFRAYALIHLWRNSE